MARWKKCNTNPKVYLLDNHLLEFLQYFDDDKVILALYKDKIVKVEQTA